MPDAVLSGTLTLPLPQFRRRTHAELLLLILTVVPVLLSLSPVFVQAQCSHPLAFSCSRFADDRGGECNFSDTGSTGAPVPWQMERFSNASASFCSTQDVWVATVPPALGNTTRFVALMATMEAETAAAGVAWRDEAQLFAELADETFAELGTMVARFNAATRLAAAELRASSVPSASRNFPLNGAVFCGGLSHQWFPSAHLVAPHVLRLHIRNSATRQLRLHAVTLDTCGQFPGGAAQPFHQRAYAQQLVLSETWVEHGRATLLDISRWAECSTRCRERDDCRAFHFDAPRGACTLLQGLHGLLQGSSGGTGSAVVGVAARSAATSVGVATFPAQDTGSNPADAVHAGKMSDPGRFSALNTFLFWRRSDDVAADTATQRVAILELRGVSALVLRVGNTNFADNSVALFVEGHRVVDCGTGELSTPFEGGFATPQSSSNTTCTAMLTCTPQAFSSPVSGRALLAYRRPPATSACAEVDSMGSVAMLHLREGAIRTHAVYYYALERQGPAASLTAAAAASHIVQLHGLWSAAAISTLRLAPVGATRQRAWYRLSGASVDEAPRWRWTTPARTLRSASVLCEFPTLPTGGYAVTNNDEGRWDARMRCGNFSSIFAAASACDDDVGCFGYTTEMNNGTERAHCLLTSAASNGTLAENFTLFTKLSVPSRMRCAVPNLGATRVSVRVASAAASNVTFRVLASGVQVGSCSSGAAASSLSGEAACSDFMTCFVGEIGTLATELLVELAPTGKVALRCPHFGTAVEVTFDPFSVVFDPAASCAISAASPVEGSCPQPTAAAQHCADTRVLQQLPFSAELCSVPQAMPSGLHLSFATTLPARVLNVLAVVDLGSLSDDSDAAVSALLQVRAHFADGSHAVLGHIFRRGVGAQMRFVSRGHASFLPRSLCADAALQNVTGTASLHAFAVPAALASRGLASLSVTGPGVGVAAAFALAEASAGADCGAFPIPVQVSDDMFHSVMPNVRHRSPPFARLQATDWAHCAERCSSDARCEAYTFSGASTCQLMRGTNVEATPPTAAISTSGIRAPTWALPSLILHSGGGNQVPTTFSGVVAAQESSNRRVFVYVVDNTASRRDIHLTVRGAASVRVFPGQTGFGGAGFIAVANAGGGGAGFVCGNGFAPFEGSEGGRSGDCNGIKSCPDLRAPPSHEFVLALSADFRGDATAAAACPSSTWGVLQVDGISAAAAAAAAGMLSGAEYFQASLQTRASGAEVTDASATAAAARPGAVEFMPSVVVNGVQQDITLSQRSNAVEDALRASTPALLCRISQRYLYRARSGQRGTSANEYACGAHATIAAAALACNLDSHCVAFTVTTASDAPRCLVRAGGFVSSIILTTLHKIESRECNFTLDTPGFITVDVLGLPLHRDSGGDVVIKLDGIEQRRCGSTRPMSAGNFLDAGETALQCSQFHQCMSDLLHRSGVLTIELPLSIGGEIVCPGTSVQALVRFEPIREASRTLYPAAAALTQHRSIRSVANPLRHALWASGVSRVGVLVQQDRYSCIGVECRIFFAINVSVGGTLISRCGGSVGFAEGIGLDGACETYFYCGDTVSVGGRREAQAVAGLSGPIHISIVEPSMQGAGFGCSGRFIAHVFSDGLMLSPQASFSAHRTMFVLRIASDDPAGSQLHTQQQVADAVTSVFSHLNVTRFPPILFNHTFRVYNYLETQVQHHFLPFDLPTMREEAKSISNGTFACIIDAHVNERMFYACEMQVQQNHMTVRVAQTNYDQIAEVITVRFNNHTIRCGGDQLFFGFRGLARQCSNYFTCFDGSVEPGSRVTIEYSTAVVQDSPCAPAAITLIEVEHREPVQPVVCDPDSDAPFACMPLGECFSLDLLCDRNRDCPDGSDEGRCTGWNFVLSNAEPQCAPLRVTSVTAGMTNGNCLRLAVAFGATTYTVNRSTCVLYTCLDFASPSLRIVVGGTSDADDATSSPMGLAFENDLHIFTTDPSIFRYCTDALHCNNNGRVVSTSPPCQCECDVQYIGASCSSLRDISLIDQIVVVLSESAASNATAVSAIMTQVVLQLPEGFQATITGSEVAGRAETGLRLTFFDPAGLPPSNTALRALLTAESQERIRAKTASAGFHYLTATSVVGNKAELACQKEAMDTPADRRCTSAVAINNTQSVTVIVPGATFAEDNVDQYIDIVLNGSEGSRSFRCAGGQFEVVRNPLRTGLCSFESVCIWTLEAELPAATADIVVGPDVNPSRIECDGFLLNMRVTVSGAVALPIDHSTSFLPTTDTERKELFLYVAIALVATGCLCGVMLVSWFKMREKFEAVKYAGPLFGAGTFFFILFAVCVYAYYIDTAELIYTHELILEEYRDRHCDQSVFSYIPHRIAFIPADGQCHQLASLGTPEGVTFMSARLTRNNRTGPVYLRSSGTLEGCEAARVITIPGESCFLESVISPTKPPMELQYIKMHGFQRLVAQQRMLAVQAFNPPMTLSSPSTVVGLLAGERFDSALAQATFLIAGIVQQRVQVVADGNIRFLVLNGSDVPAVVRDVPNHPRRVVFRAVIETERTAFERGAINRVESQPLQAGDDDSTFTAIGTLFNDHGTNETELAGVAAFRDAHYYLGINRIGLDVGKETQFTFSFWMRASSRTRGLVFAVMDNWVTDAFESPLLTRLMNIIENTDETVGWFNEDWRVYSAFYVDGNTESLHWAWASPESGVQEVRWDARFIGVSRLFDGGWHMVSVVVSNTAARREALLYVDGQTSFAQEGWLQCIDSAIPETRSLRAGEEVLIFNNRQESVKAEPCLVLGYLNAGLYDFHVVPRALTQEQVLQRGAGGMDLYSKVPMVESTIVGWVTLLFAAVIILYSFYQAWQKLFGITEEDEEETLENKGRHAASAAPAASQPTNAITKDSASSANAVQFWQFVQPVTSVAQGMALFFGGWAWPAIVTDTFARFYELLSFNLVLFLPALPDLLWPVVQFFLSTAVLFGLLHFAIRDEERHSYVIQHYRETQRARKQKKMESVVPLSDAVAKPHYKWVIHLEKGRTIPVTPEQEETLVRTLTDLITQRNRREANMRLHTKKLIDMGSLGTGILLYERINGKVCISFRASDRSIQEDKDAPTVNVTQTVIEQIADNVECPEHGKRLLPDDFMTATCVHSENPFFRSMSCPRNCIMYRCPVDLCDYAVCEYCYNGGAISGALSGALAKIQELRKHGAIGTVGTFTVLIAGIVYLPVVKNAMMIIFCHPSYQCIFTRCWSDPDMFYIIAVLMSFLVLFFIAIGFVVVQLGLLYKRHRALVDILPIQRAQRKYNCWLLPQNIVRREDYVEYLKLDNSMLKSLYEPFEFSYFWFSPAQLIYKAGVVVAIVVSEPNTLSQLTAVTAVEVIFAMMLIGMSPYKNIYVEALARLGSFHQLIQLGLSALHRVDIRNDPTGRGYENQMIAASGLYLLIVVFLLIIVVIVPSIRTCYGSYKRRRDEEMNRNQTDMYDIGFWGNPNRTEL